MHAHAHLETRKESPRSSYTKGGVRCHQAIQVHMLKERLAAIEDSLRRKAKPEQPRPVPPIRIFQAPGEAGTLTLAEYLEMLVELMR